jgi:hypothetical protein
MSPPFSGSKKDCFLPIYAGFLLGSFFDPEYGANIFLQNLG